jgi:hypothetical protein
VLLATVDDPLKVSVELIVLVITCNFSPGTGTHVVVKKLLPNTGPLDTHDATGTGGAVFVVLQVVAPKPLPALAAALVQDATNVVVVSVVQVVTSTSGPIPGVHTATAVGPVRVGAGQLICVKPLANNFACGVHVPSVIPIELLFVEQVVVTQPLPDVAVIREQFATGELVTLFVVQAVRVNALPELPVAAAVQFCTGWLLTTRGAGQVVVVKPLPRLAALAVQAPATVTGVAVGQVVVVNKLPGVGPLAEQAATPWSVVMGAGQVVVFQPLDALAAAAVQFVTGELVVIIAGGHDVVVKLLPAFGVVTGVQLATGSLTRVLAEQAVVAM